MKKYAIGIMIILLSSCNNDDDRNVVTTTPGYLNFQDIVGTWYMSKVITPNGTIQNYIHNCSTERDVTEYYNIMSVKERLYYPDCSGYYNWSNCSNGLIIQGFVVTGCEDKYDGTYTLSGNTLRIDYPETKSFPFPENNFTDAKGIILTRN